ncbi:T9SS type A sorting domain-containing protein [Flavobacterium eburneipallidum]|uniref:rhamnogalacturonan lyase family protein n=1 Tax=Flavobacterium eburneipallidum TaxID=3003263 RepID=UPI0024827844|nr:T9SS type A sorting domain-containing protein [Flavobacterium eburneipallidum]
MNKKITLNSFQKLILLLLFLFGTSYQINAQRQIEKLNRGLVAMRLNASQVYVGWRMLGTEAPNISYNLYCNDVKVTGSPFTSTTNFTHSVTTNGTYKIRAIVNGVEQPESESATVWANQYLDIAMQIPPSGTNRDGETYTYSVNDCSVGDVDGDGQYEIFVKWDPSNSKDNSQPGFTGNVYIDCYRLNGTRLWRIDMGKNIRAGAHYTQFMVYDLDSDGKAEMSCRTADGTIDGTGVVIGDVNADYRNTSGSKTSTSTYGAVISGPEFLTIFNGETGKAMATTNYLPARGVVNNTTWGDSYGGRSERFVDAIAYLDGEKPSLVTGRGYYTRLVRVAWDWRNNTLSQRWIFDSNTSGNSAYAGQGNHQMTVGDVDGDGKDEISNGSSGIDDNGAKLYANGLGHGDALHMSDMDPDRPGQEIWQCLEEQAKYGNNGLVFLDAQTGVKLWGVPTTGDIGRANAADIDPRYKGYEVWGSTGGLYDCKGNQITTSRPSINFSIWWDADLNRELLDSNRIDKWNHLTGNSSRLLTATEYSSNNTTKATPALSADLFGDWREEVIFRKTDNTAIRIYITNIPTTHKLYTLMHDTQYRVAIAWQNSAYNQPPHPSFYLGVDMAAQTQPNVVIARANLANQDFSNTKSANAILYPNPTSQTFTIKAEGQFTYTIHNVLGVKVGSGRGENQVEVGEIATASGLYIITVTSEKGTSSIKLIKE